MKQRHFIDSHKAATGLFVLALMAVYAQWHNATAWIYLALHGGYGLLWVLKSHMFPDKQWEQPSSLGYGLVIWASLTLYWIAPRLLVSRGVQAPPWYLGTCVFIFTLGIFWHFVSDMQKHIFLKLSPGHLLTDGLWSRLRNPNYFGELLIYLGFGMLAMHWVPLLVIVLFVLIVWLPNMRRKDRSLTRYPDFAGYRARSRLFLPFVW